MHPRTDICSRVYEPLGNRWFDGNRIRSLWIDRNLAMIWTVPNPRMNSAVQTFRSPHLAWILRCSSRCNPLRRSNGTAKIKRNHRETRRRYRSKRSRIAFNIGKNLENGVSVIVGCTSEKLSAINFRIRYAIYRLTKVLEVIEPTWHFRRTVVEHALVVGETLDDIFSCAQTFLTKYTRGDYANRNIDETINST